MDEYGVPRSYGSHEELLRDDEIDAVAVTLGHHLHHRLTVDACNAGKHVLVEETDGDQPGAVRRHGGGSGGERGLS